MISTCDFFYPLVDDPYVQGEIAACNVLSDMYAIGVVLIDNVLMILAACKTMDPEPQHIVTRKMIEGFTDACKEAGTECTGGQTVFNPWPIIGGTAMSTCSPNEFIMPVSAVAGDLLVLTKPLGIQVAVNINEWRQWADQTNWNKVLEVMTAKEARDAFETAQESMSRLNKEAAKLMHKYGAHATTDITGFGILGHASNLATNQKASVDFEITVLPIINKMKEVALHMNRFRGLLEGNSAETSGGLYIALPAESAQLFVNEIKEITGKPAWIVGRVVAAVDPLKNQARILDPTVVPV